ncbi:MAG: hypothetical protein ACRD0W_17405, partial [Acidimicrobiales bacterium]
DVARGAFTEALQLAAATSAAVAIGIAILSAVLLRPARSGAEREPRPDQELDEGAAGSDHGDKLPGPVATAAGRPERG